jgi:hypothetical protein
MRRAFPGAQINAPKDRRYDYGLEDHHDGHDAHAALIGKADAIVTDDSRAGFTTALALSEAGIDVVTAREFAANTVAAHPTAGLRALLALSGRMATPPQTPREVLDDLRDRYGMDEVADILSPLLEETE